MSIVSIVVMYTGFIYWEHIVSFVKPEDLGPTLSRVFGIIALFNIGLFEYEWLKIKNTRTVSLIMAFVSLANSVTTQHALFVDCKSMTSSKNT